MTWSALVANRQDSSDEMSNLALRAKAEDEAEGMAHYAVRRAAPKVDRKPSDDEMSNLALNVRGKPSALKKPLPLPQPDLE